MVISSSAIKKKKKKKLNTKFENLKEHYAYICQLFSIWHAVWLHDYCFDVEVTTKICANRHMATVVITVATWPDRHVVYKTMSLNVRISDVSK
jgi:hypothetical protein